MKANELRVTNYVLNYNNDVNVVLFIGYDSVQLVTPRGNDFTEKLTDIQPIPLTEEWLERFGFEKNPVSNNIMSWGNGKIALNTYIELGEKRFYWLRWYQHHTSIRIYFVHQLQNLFYALTGEELKNNR